MWKGEAEEGESGGGRTRAGPAPLALKMEEGPQAKENAFWPLKAGKAKDTDPPLEPPERKAIENLISVHRDPIRLLTSITIMVRNLYRLLLSFR